MSALSGSPRPLKRHRIAPRLPCFAPVLATGLEHCWMTNVSASGMGLTTSSVGPVQGDEIELSFELADSGVIRAIARVAWTGRVQDDGRLGFGVQFRELSPHDRALLGRYLAAHRLRVVVAFASLEERALVESCFDDLEVELVDRLDQLDATLLHTSASIIVFADCIDRLTTVLDILSGAPGPVDLPLAAVTIVMRIESERLRPLLERGKIYDVLRPPLDDRTLIRAAERSCERWALKFELRWASLQLEGAAIERPPPVARAAEGPHNAAIIRSSAEMRRVYELIQTVAVHDVPVLLSGETGTGKELAAREIHALSRRADKPFIAQDCGALIETLLESELFGHVRGAFTGATGDHPGLFQIADRGTIFLDEIQNTSPALQAKLLRVIELGEVRPVGGTKARRVDVRLIAASNSDLVAAVARGQFRSDLYYRLDRFPIQLPPLRDHPDDILPLARHFTATTCASLGCTSSRLDSRAEAALLAYAWPGNIRELRNAIERALLLTKPNEPVRWDVLPDAIRRAGSAEEPAGGLDAQVAELERRLILTALERHGGVLRRAARDLQLHPVTLSRRMKRLGIDSGID